MSVRPEDAGQSITVADGVPEYVIGIISPVSVTAILGDGATGAIYGTTTPTASVRAAPAGAHWFPIETGLAEDTPVVYPGPLTALKLVSDGAASEFEVADSR